MTKTALLRNKHVVIDTSTIIAILLGEPDAPLFIKAIAEATKRLVSAFTALECAVVIEVRKGPAGVRELDLLFHEACIEVVGMDREQVALAREAYRRFGKGNHPARLNLGDCCSYALSLKTGEPLLYQGHDFSQTDVRSAI
jgi:ribonuclease VapC